MAESKKDEKSKQESASSQVLRNIRDNVKAEIKDAAETASLKMKLARAEKEKRELLRRLGEVSYERLRPKHGSVQSELEERAEALAVSIGKKSQEITGLKLRIKLRKAGGDYTRITDKKNSGK